MSRKNAILKAAIFLFAERGFHATSTSAVAKMAGVAEGLIFHYFKNKEGIFLHILKEMMDAYIEEMGAIVEKAGSGLEAIEQLIYFHSRYSEKRSKEFLLVIRNFPFELMKEGSAAREFIVDRSAQILNLLQSCIERGRSDGSIRELKAEKTAIIIAGMLNGVSRLKMLGTLPVPDLTSEMIDFCRYALAK